MCILNLGMATNPAMKELDWWPCWEGGHKILLYVNHKNYAERHYQFLISPNVFHYTASLASQLGVLT